MLYLHDEQAGKKAWDDYINPLTDTIKQLSLRDCIKGTAALGTGLVAQHKMLKGLGSFYATTKAKALEFAKNNPHLEPEAYMRTPEGLLFKATCNTKSNGRQKIKDFIGKNSKTPWDIKTRNTGKIDYDFNGKKLSAYRDPQKRYWWAADTEGHGGSKFKVFEFDGKYLRWIHDADEYGNFIVDKHKGTVGLTIKVR